MLHTYLTVLFGVLVPWTAAASALGDATWTFANGRSLIFQWDGARAGVYRPSTDGQAPKLIRAGSIGALGTDAVAVDGVMVPVTGITAPELEFAGRRALIVSTFEGTYLMSQSGGVTPIETLEAPARTRQDQIVIKSLRRMNVRGADLHIVFIPWRRNVQRGPVAFAGEAWALRDDGVGVRFAVTTDVDPPLEVEVHDEILTLKGYPRALDLRRLGAEASVQTTIARIFSDGRSLDTSGWNRAQEIFSRVPRGRAPDGVRNVDALDRVTRALTTGRRSVVLTGPTGVGKESLARAAIQHLPRTWTVFEVTPDGFNSTSGVSGGFDARLLVMKAASESRPVVWWLRDFAGFNKLGLNVQRTADFFDGLAPEMNQGLVRLLGIAGDEGFAETMRARATLNPVVDRVRLSAADEQATISIVAHALTAANVSLDAAAFVALRDWGRRFTPDLVEPGRTKRLTDAAIEAAAARGSARVEMIDARSAVVDRVGVPRAFVDHGLARETLERLKADLSTQAPGQADARAMILRAARATLFNLNAPERPRFAGLLLGPPDAGKGALVQSYAEALELPSESLAMGVFARDGDVDAFLKAAGDFARANPHGVLFLDDFDSAAPRVQTALASVLESGGVRRAEVEGAVSTRGLQIFVGSNAGAEYIAQSAAQGRSLGEDALWSAATVLIPKSVIDHLDAVAGVQPTRGRDLRAVVERRVELALNHFAVTAEQIKNYREMIDHLSVERVGAGAGGVERNVSRAIRGAIGEILESGAIEDPRGLATARFNFDGVLRLECERALEPAATVIPFAPR